MLSADLIWPPSWLSLGVTLIVLLATAAGWLYHSLRRRKFTKPFASLPVPQGGPAGCHLIYGHLRYVNPDFVAAQKWVSVDSADAQGRTGYWHIFQPGISLTHWQDARQVLMAEEYREPLKILGKHIKKFLGYNNLLLLHGKVWKHHRSAIAKTFTPAGLASYKEAMVQVVGTMCQSILKKIDASDAGYFETTIEPLMKMITMDVFGLTAFSTDFGSSKTITPSPFATAFDALASGMTTRFNTNPLRPSNFFYSYPTELNRQHKQAHTLLRHFLVEQILQQRQNGSTGSKSWAKKDLLTYMVEAHGASKDHEISEGGAESADEILMDNVLTLLFAGYDTTSITLCYALYLVSQSPDIYETCVAEVDACTNLVNTDELNYCQAIIRETLRLYCPAPATLRLLRKDIVLHDGFVIPKGTVVYIPIWAMHRLEVNYARGDEFLPERWVAKDASGKWVDRGPSVVFTDNDGGVPAANPQALFAFSGGARNCPGSRFALQEATIVLAGLLKHLRFDALPNYELTPTKVGLVLHPHDCLPMHISCR